MVGGPGATASVRVCRRCFNSARKTLSLRNNIHTSGAGARSGAAASIHGRSSGSTVAADTSSQPLACLACRPGWPRFSYDRSTTSRSSENLISCASGYSGCGGGRTTSSMTDIDTTPPPPRKRASCRRPT